MYFSEQTRLNDVTLFWLILGQVTYNHMISYHKSIIEYNVKPIPNIYAVPLCGCVVICYINKSEKVNLGGLISKSLPKPQQQA